MIKSFVILCVRWYQRQESPLHLRCRFEPTCSEYTVLAVQKFGVLTGLWLSTKRLVRCRPPNGGVDYP
ncbi:membrane protein insertion efficiency factor YidD [Solidesulfovibrio magneticus]|uniref:Membrane protein insertion efficiency factor n=1 Tax=Solidesulfovibrio magneticus (strain ATCC 700980 / DSM 13731 / RS-1) TaxID=573370 RepID=C4XN99_SOLM1|nr:membrane protein insertion efficiency factor YidD [Solidesulfovibrio magneticus]BAH77402.1 hypothetical protein DMR_39110 [Solidesulfovibrio magneticus RS-1]